MPDKQPNIVFVLCDNTGWGDFSCYGGDTPTPRIDALASEGIRFNNYTVEAQCTPTRSALLTGRQSVRSGTYKVVFPGQGLSGLVPWEYTIAELLSDAGYATSLWGKWHCGDVEGRLPNDQGFDEWWGYKNSVDEAGWTSYAAFDALAKAAGVEAPQIWEGKKGSRSTAVRELNLEVRPLLDELIVGKATDYIKRAAAGDKPFFTYVALSHMHPPEAVHPDFDQTDPSRLGMYADIIAEMDYRVGQIVDCVDEAGIADNTIIVFSSDNGPGMIDVHPPGGSSGPFRGGFMTPPWEGSMRVAAMVRWPGKVPAGVVTEEMLSAHDWYQTFAALAGASDKMPTDRPMDGVDASKFLLGKSEKTGRETHPVLRPRRVAHVLEVAPSQGGAALLRGHLRADRGAAVPDVLRPRQRPRRAVQPVQHQTRHGLDVRGRTSARRRVPQQHRRVPEHRTRLGVRRIPPGSRRQQLDRCR